MTVGLYGERCVKIFFLERGGFILKSGVQSSNEFSRLTFHSCRSFEFRRIERES